MSEHESNTDENEHEQDDELQVTLTPDNFDRLLSFQAEGEPLDETMNRVLGLMPHAVRFKEIGVDPTTLDKETTYVHSRWRDEDGLVEDYLYESPMAVARTFPKGLFGFDPDQREAKERLRGHIPGAEGQSDIAVLLNGVQMNFVDGYEDAIELDHETPDGEITRVFVRYDEQSFKGISATYWSAEENAFEDEGTSYGLELSEKGDASAIFETDEADITVELREVQ